jgi:hypothetical protein
MVYDRVSREQRGCSQTGAEYNRLVVMVGKISENERAVLVADLIAMFPPLLQRRWRARCEPVRGLIAGAA